MTRLIESILSSGFIYLLYYNPAYAQHGGRTADQIHFSVISSTAVTFDWVGSDSSFSYGTDSILLSNQVYAVSAAYLPVDSPWISDPGPYWEAKLTGLQENTAYYYRIGDNGQLHAFKTPPPRGTADFRVCSTSDMQETTPECKEMFQQIAGMKPAIVITTGDLTGGDSGGQQQVGERFHDAMAWSLRAAWMPSWGNHDWENPGGDDLRTYKGRFDIPNPQACPSSPAVGCCGEDWGWFDYGNTRFISLPERYNSSSTWQDWSREVRPVFDEAQNDSLIKFIVTYGHQSAYTSAYRRYGGSGTLKNILNGLHASFPKYMLDLSGHNHQYERYSLSSGMTYIINSTAGSYYRGWDSPVKPDICSFRAIHYGIVVLDFSDDAIQVQFICSVGTSRSGADYKPLEEDVCDAPGSVIDAFTIFADGVTTVGETPDRIPDGFMILNYPNPFRISTKISFNLGQAGHVRIEIYNLIGKKLLTLEEPHLEKGEHTFEWLAKDGKGNHLPEGIYIVRISTDNTVSSKRLMLK